MRILYSSMNLSEIGLLKSLMAEEGIECVIRNEHTSRLMGSVPFTECFPELWVTNESDLPRAEALLQQWQGNQNLEPWTCPECGEENEGQFGACWKCGYALEENS